MRRDLSSFGSISMYLPRAYSKPSHDIPAIHFASGIDVGVMNALVRAPIDLVKLNLPPRCAGGVDFHSDRNERYLQKSGPGRPSRHVLSSRSVRDQDRGSQSDDLWLPDASSCSKARRSALHADRSFARKPQPARPDARTNPGHQERRPKLLKAMARRERFDAPTF